MHFVAKLRRHSCLTQGLVLAFVWSSLAWAGGVGWDHSGIYTVTFSQSGKAFEVNMPVGGGAIVRELGGRGGEYDVAPRTLDRLRIQLTGEGPQDGDYSVVKAVLPGPFGDPSTLTVIGHLEESSMMFSGLIVNEEGAMTGFEVAVPRGSTFDTKAVVVIILSAAAVGALACLAGNYLVDCGERCSDSCGEHGVERWTEVCGSCRCECR